MRVETLIWVWERRRSGADRLFLFVLSEPFSLAISFLPCFRYVALTQSLPNGGRASFSSQQRAGLTGLPFPSHNFPRQGTWRVKQLVKTKRPSKWNGQLVWLHRRTCRPDPSSQGQPWRLAREQKTAGTEERSRATKPEWKKCEWVELTFTTQQQGTVNLEEWNTRCLSPSNMQLTKDRKMAEVFRFFIENKTKILEFMKN